MDKNNGVQQADGLSQVEPQSVSPVPASIPDADWRDGSSLEGFKWPLGGFAPGHYMGKCLGCDDTVMNVDKRAMLCLRCSLDALRDAFEAIDCAFRIKVWNEAKGRGLSDRAAMEEVSHQRAKAIEAQRAETQGGSVHESAGRQASPKEPTHD